MKRTLIALFVSAALVVPVLTGCHTPTQQKVAVNTLFTIHKTVDATLATYLDLVVNHTVATNSVPKVLSSYGTFQQAYNGAIIIVLGNTNAVAPQSVVDAAASFTSTVTVAKVGVY